MEQPTHCFYLLAAFPSAFALGQGEMWLLTTGKLPIGAVFSREAASQLLIDKVEMPIAARHLSTSLCCIIIGILVVSIGTASAETVTLTSPRPYLLSRADEDYRYLSDPGRRTGF